MTIVRKTAPTGPTILDERPISMRPKSSSAAPTKIRKRPAEKKNGETVDEDESIQSANPISTASGADLVTRAANGLIARLRRGAASVRDMR